MSDPAPGDFEPLDITDTRSPLQLLADDAHRWPDGRLHVPPGLRGPEVRGFVRTLLRLEAVADPATAARFRREWVRASGLCVCRRCGLPYADHPHDVDEPDLVILCDRSRVKL